MTSQAPKKRGRPHKVYPFFSDPEAERERVEKCIAEGREPYPPFKHEPCEAELSLRRDVEPWVPFDLVLALNDTDPDGLPYCSPLAAKRWEEAKAKQKSAAQSGAAASHVPSLAARIIEEEADFIIEKRKAGWRASRVFRAISIRRQRAGQPVAGRSQMYEHLELSGLW